MQKDFGAKIGQNLGETGAKMKHFSSIFRVIQENRHRNLKYFDKIIQ